MCSGVIHQPYFVVCLLRTKPKHVKLPKQTWLFSLKCWKAFVPTLNLVVFRVIWEWNLLSDTGGTYQAPLQRWAFLPAGPPCPEQWTARVPRRWRRSWLTECTPCAPAVRWGSPPAAQTGRLQPQYLIWAAPATGDSAPAPSSAGAWPRRSPRCHTQRGTPPWRKRRPGRKRSRA